jgi:hypothetical protein
LYDEDDVMMAYEVRRFLHGDQIDEDDSLVYNNKQNVHNSTIVKSIKDSLAVILTEEVIAYRL